MGEQVGEKQVAQNPFQFTQENLVKIRKEISHYPEGHQASVVLFALDTAQRQEAEQEGGGGRLSIPAVEAVATLLNMPPIRVLEVARFHTLFHFDPVGRYHLQICGTPPCSLVGAEEALAFCRSSLRIALGEVTPDGLFSVEEVECLGACTKGPVMQVNDRYYEDLSIHKLQLLLEEWRKESADAS